MKNIKEIASSYIGIREGSKQHKALVSKYNKIKPLPRGYKLKETDPWCAAFASVCFTSAGLPASLAEVSVQRMYNNFKLAGRLTKSPRIGYLVFYQWDTGPLDHVGIITNIDGNYLEVTEGNFHDSVGVRRVSKSSRWIVSYGITQDIEDDRPATPVPQVVLDVIRGKYGNGAERIQKLTAAGYDADEVQEAVNMYLATHK